MMRSRQRPAWRPDQLAEIYAGPHDHRVLAPGHDLRMERTIAIARAVYRAASSVADLSCGVGTVAEALGAPVVILGDFAPGYPFHGPIEETIDEIPHVDVFICTETLEHLDDPDMVLRKIRGKASALVVSLPICEVPEDDANGEHYWAFDREGAEAMYRAAGWEPALYEQVEAAPGSVEPTYQCGIWGLR
jgi:hypothetical protein